MPTTEGETMNPFTVVIDDGSGCFPCEWVEAEDCHAAVMVAARTILDPDHVTPDEELRKHFSLCAVFAGHIPALL
jgi:hypothetical protein